MIANGSPCAWDYSSREHGSKVGRGREERGLAKPGGYGCPTLKDCNWWAQQAFFAGKKAEKTSQRESTARTLKEVGQQDARVLSDRRSKTEMSVTMRCRDKTTAFCHSALLNTTPRSDCSEESQVMRYIVALIRSQRG